MSIKELEYTERGLEFLETSAKKILILDGAMGTMIMRYNPEEADFRGESFKNHDVFLKGCNDVLSISRPEIIYNIHKSYLEAGADIIETNSFNCNIYSLADYKLEDKATEIAKAAATTARKASDDYSFATGRKTWVGGSMGPTSKSLTMSYAMDDKSVNSDTLTESYKETAKALIEGGVDIIIIETIFDTLNAKCAAIGAIRAMEEAGVRVPVMFSVTLTENMRTLSGMTLEGFVEAIRNYSPFAITLNCGFGIDGMIKPLAKLQNVPCLTGIYPNAGLPDEMGAYNDTPEYMASKLTGLLEKRWINIIGGCCGTTPEHIKCLAQTASKYLPRIVPTTRPFNISGLSPLEIKGDGFIMVGERCNVAGSRKFLRLIKEGKTDEALKIAESQVRAGAGVIDINLDDPMLNGTKEMVNFLKEISLNPVLAEIPVMVDTANPSTVREALKITQGRAIVNSISLKAGEKEFIKEAKEIRELGAIPVIMAFDEKGQATTTERRMEIFRRAFKLLTEEVGYRPEDIIFDPNILTVCTGIEEHNYLAKDFIESVTRIKESFPGVKISGGVSNLSFAFRGNNEVREAMHTVFLHYAKKAGMDMAIVNPSTMKKIEDITPELVSVIEDAFFREPGKESTERLVEYASRISQEAKTDSDKKESNSASKSTDCAEELTNKILKADSSDIETVIEKCLAEGMKPMKIIDGPLMAGMNKIGELFEQGKLFLPQVVKSAEVMKAAVDYLNPYIEKEETRNDFSSRKRMVLATVKGDVHDIGKNIVGVIMRCNGWDVIDLGVMVEPEEIIRTSKEQSADAIGLSGLITPSLAEMAEIAMMMEKEGLKTPLFVGGATTSALHTAVKLAPLYSGPIVHTSEAASLPGVAHAVTGEKSSAEITALKAEQSRIAEDYNASLRESKKLSLEEARAHRHITASPSAVPAVESSEFEMTITEVAPFINWRAFLSAWKLPFNNVSANDGSDSGALLQEAQKLLESLSAVGATVKARVEIRPVKVTDETIFIENNGGSTIELNAPRQLKPQPDGKEQLSLADFLDPKGDFLGFFAVTVSGKISELIDKYKKEGENYKGMVLQTLADRLVEAGTELMHYKVRKSIWGFSPDEPLDPEGIKRHEYVGIRPAVGYPSLPNQMTIFILDKILDYKNLGIKLTENGAMSPAASTTGLIFASPDSRYFSV